MHHQGRWRGAPSGTVRGDDRAGLPVGRGHRPPVPHDGRARQLHWPTARGAPGADATERRCRRRHVDGYAAAPGAWSRRALRRPAQERRRLPHRRHPAGGAVATGSAGRGRGRRGPEAFLFGGAGGRPLRRGTFYKAWHVAVEKVGLPPGFRFHDLHRTGNTLAAATGASTKELMVRLGHSSPRAALIYQRPGARRRHRRRVE
ncbi:MAG: tyrosine-type recombinase/integrase [Acidimicrobiales bacterium]